MNLLNRAFLSACLALFLAGCGKRTPDPFEMLSMDIRDTDSSFLTAVLKDELSTRENPKPKARFVFSDSGSTSSRYSNRYSLIISKADGCLYRFDYPGRDKPAFDPQDTPGLPFAAIKSISMSGDEAPFKMQASGRACIAKAMRADLVQARATLSERVKLPLDLNKKFAQAVPPLMEAMRTKSAPDPNSRFVMIATVSGKTDEVAFLERSTGCQWNATLSGGLLRANGIEPAGCLSNVYDAYFQEPAASSPASEPKASP